MKRIVRTASSIVLVLALMSPAMAHFLTVRGGAPGGGPGPGVWVGGPVGLDAEGRGLVLGGPTGDLLMPPSHVKGLNTACEALDANGVAAADIRGPGGPGCPHGQ
jgi:hypothetical protein